MLDEPINAEIEKFADRYNSIPSRIGLLEEYREELEGLRDKIRAYRQYKKDLKDFK